MAGPDAQRAPESPRRGGSFREVLLYFGLTLDVARDPQVRPSLYAIAVWLGVGTVAYRLLEGWTLLDAFYFSTVTLATVGYGDVSPHTTAGKLFTVFYILIGVGTLAMLLNGIVHRNIQLVHDRASRRDAAEREKATAQLRESNELL